MHDGVDAIISHLSQKLNLIFYDREFVGSVREDLEIILQNDKHVCLLFPKLKPFFLKALRYEALIFGLKVFYIGEGHNRAAVVCKESLFVYRREETNGCCDSKTTRERKKDFKIMEEEETSTKHVSKKGNRASRPTQSFYVPPAKRILSKKSKNFSASDNTVKSGKKNVNDMAPTETINCKKKCEINQISEDFGFEILPEREVRSDIVLEAVEKLTLQDTEESCPTSHDSILNHSLIESNSTELITHGPLEQISHTKLTVYDPLESGNNEGPVRSGSLEALSNQEPTGNLFTNPEELISKFMVNDSMHICFSESGLNSQLCEMIIDATDRLDVIKTVDFPTSTEVATANGIISNEDTYLYDIQNLGNITEDPVTPELMNNSDDDQLKNNTNLYISYSSRHTHSLKDDSENENKKIQRTIENINRRSKPLIKHIHTNDTLQIDTNEKQDGSYSVNNKNKSRSEIENERIEESNVSNWEDMFDENGDLQKKYVGEIAKHIGCDVQILKATNDYSSYQSILQDLEHVIELYDFPSTFRTQDLIQLYSDAYQDAMYVKWCDETHALLVLSTPAQAQRALKIEHDIIKSRPLIEGSKVATLVANCTDLKPAMKRPQTNMQTARRLINTHLGTKVKLSREMLEEERKILISAREQKRLERQNEKDAWEGNPRNRR